MTNKQEKPQQQNFINGALWMLAMRWMLRALGLISTIILARILTPVDFGIVALALIVVGLLEIISSTAVDLALIRDKKTTREHYDTAWTIQIIQGIFIAYMLIFSAPYASIYFDEPLLSDVIRLLSLRALISSFQNIAIVDFRKKLNFSADFRFNFYKKFITFLFVVALAFTLKNYWALVLGMIVAAVVEVFISYTMHTFRPRISLKQTSEIWSFSQWILLSRIGYFLNQKTDQIVIGGLSNTQIMGEYHISTEMASLAPAEVVMPLRRAFFPNFAKIMNQPENYRNSILKAIGGLSIAIFAVGIGVSAISEDFVLLVLGEKWRGTIPLIQILSVFSVAAGLSSSMELLLLVSNRGDLSTIESWLQLMVLVPSALYAAHFFGLYEVAIARTIVSIIFVFLMIYFLTIATPVKFLSIIGVIWRPAIASTIMYFVIQTCHRPELNMLPLRLLIDITIGSISYFASLFFLWLVTGCLPGIERDIYTKILSTFRNH